MITRCVFYAFLLLFLSLTNVLVAQTDSLLNEYELLKNSNDKVDYGNKLVKTLCNIDTKAALHLAKQNLALSKKREYKYGEAMALSRVGWAFDFSDQVDSSVYYYQLGIAKYKQLGKQKEVADNTNNIGVCYYLHGFYPEAVKYYLKTLEFRKELKDTIGTQKIYNNLGLINWKLKSYNESKKYYLLSLELGKTLADTSAMLSVLTNLANCETTLKKFKKSIEYSNEVIHLSLLKNDKFSATIEKITLAVNYDRLNQLDKSIALSQEVIDELEKDEKKIANRKYLVIAYGGVASALLKKKSFSAALDYAEKALAISRKKNNAAALSDIYTIIWQANIGLKKTPEALHSLEQAYTYKDSVYNMNTARARAELKTKFQIDSVNLAQRLITQEEITKRIQAEKLQEAESKKNNYLLGSLVFLALLLTSLVALFYHNNQSKKRLAQKNEIIKKALDEKELLLKEVHHRVKNNLQVISSLLRMQSRHIKDDASKAAIEEAHNRILAMEIIHKKLYQQEDLSQLNIQKHLTSLCKEVFAGHKIFNKKNDLKLEIENIQINLNDLISLGLILNELIANALKHGLKNMEKAKLFISLKKHKTNDIKLIVRDNGKGLPENFQSTKNDSFGLKIVNSIAETMEGTVNYFSDNGTIVEIYFKQLVKS